MPSTPEDDFADNNGKAVHQFALEMQNIGLPVVADKLISMLESGTWQAFRDGLGDYRFLPGEFDYFLSQQGVPRDVVMHSVVDISFRARLDAAMDERQTGTDEYRRPLDVVRRSNPRRPGQEIQPFGLTRAEASRLVREGTLPTASSRPALGASARRTREGKPSRAATPPLVERLCRSAKRLTTEQLESLASAVAEELERRGVDEDA